MRKTIYEQALRWEANSRQPQDWAPYVATVDELLFHSDLRFHQYVQFQSEGEFPTRLLRWLENLRPERERQALLLALRHLLFIDSNQYRALAAEAFRGVIVPFLVKKSDSVSTRLRPAFQAELLQRLSDYGLLSVTTSLSFDDFLNVNDLAGLPKPTVLGEKLDRIPPLLDAFPASIKGLIVLEDFVGSGRQAVRVLSAVRAHWGPSKPILFIPLIAMERATEEFQKKPALKITYKPILTIPRDRCLEPDPRPKEPEIFKRMRTVVLQTARRALARHDHLDDPPSDPFGFGRCGALVVTSHNTPNNTLPLIHHRSPDWFALFRRLHHGKDGL